MWKQCIDLATICPRLLLCMITSFLDVITHGTFSPIFSDLLTSFSGKIDDCEGCVAKIQKVIPKSRKDKICFGQTRGEIIDFQCFFEWKMESPIHLMLVYCCFGKFCRKLHVQKRAQLTSGTKSRSLHYLVFKIRKVATGDRNLGQTPVAITFLS